MANLEQMLEAPMPTKSEQRRRSYRPDEAEAKRVFRAINKAIFGDTLHLPPIRFARTKACWGWCDGTVKPYGEEYVPYTKEIVMYPYYPSIHLFIATLAHEMVHHWQWTVKSVERRAQGKEPLMSHGPSFTQWRQLLKKYGLPLDRHL